MVGIGAKQGVADSDELNKWLTRNSSLTPMPPCNWIACPTTKRLQRVTTIFAAEAA
jgi:hypothetical protein